MCCGSDNLDCGGNSDWSGLGSGADCVPHLGNHHDYSDLCIQFVEMSERINSISHLYRQKRRKQNENNSNFYGTFNGVVPFFCLWHRAEDVI